MVYVSCNASTLAQDLVSLTRIYQVNSISGHVPHTDRSSCESSEEVKERMDIWEKNLEAKAALKKVYW